MTSIKESAEEGMASTRALAEARPGPLHDQIHQFASDHSDTHSAGMRLMTR